MKYFSFLGFLLLWVPCLYAQLIPTVQATPIVEEGQHLYRLELAAWFGTDLFLSQYPTPEEIGGYFSYVDGDSTKCIFYSQGAQPEVMGTIAFEEAFSMETGQLVLTRRPFTKAEKLRYKMREKVLESMATDTLVKMYDNTSLNLIPTVWGGERKVYILTGPQVPGVIIFGNDYLFRFDKKLEIIERKALHQNMMPIEYEEAEETEKRAVAGMHAHSDRTGDFITATDICTLLLYAEYTGWETHQVVSRRYLNIWNCKAETLAVFPRETMDKLQKYAKNKERKRAKREAKKK